MIPQSRANTQSPVLRELEEALEPECIVTDTDALQRYSHDAWPVSVVKDKLGQHHYIPDVAVVPRNEQDVLTTLRIATTRQIPVTTRALGSSVTGQPLPVHGGILLDLSQLTGPAVLDEANHLVTAPAGVCGGDLEAWLNARDLTLNHFPQSLLRSSIGGWLATRATGQLSSRFHGIEDLVAGYRVILVDGTVIDIGSKPRSAVGPDLKALFLGAEGTLGVIVRVTLKVFSRSQHLVSHALCLPTVGDGLAAMREVMHAGLRPSLVRFYDEHESRHAAPKAAPAGCLLFLTYEGSPGVVAAEVDATLEITRAHGAIEIGGQHVEDWYERRFDFSTIERVLAPRGGYAETIEVAHLWSDIGELYVALRDALSPFADEVLGHFSHVYDQGVSLYIILLGQAPDDIQALERLNEIWETAMRVTLEHGGEISHHHGAGLARQQYVREGLGTQHVLLTRLKAALDPNGILNPGKLGLHQADAAAQQNRTGEK